MLKLYFGSSIATQSTLSVLFMLAYIIFLTTKRTQIHTWGRHIIILAAWGLIVCCLVATRDLYHHSVQHAIDASVAPGLFSINSIQSTLGCIGGAVIVITLILTLFLKNQEVRMVLFYILSCAIVFKTAVIEVSRLVLH